MEIEIYCKKIKARLKRLKKIKARLMIESSKCQHTTQKGVNCKGIKTIEPSSI